MRRVNDTWSDEWVKDLDCLVHGRVYPRTTARFVKAFHGFVSAAKAKSIRLKKDAA